MGEWIQFANYNNRMYPNVPFCHNVTILLRYLQTRNLLIQAAEEIDKSLKNNNQKRKKTDY